MMKKLLLIATLFLINTAVYSMQEQPAEKSKAEAVREKKYNQYLALSNFDHKCNEIRAWLGDIVYSAKHGHEDFHSEHYKLKRELAELYRIWLFDKKVARMVTPSPSFNALAITAHRLNNELKEDNNEKTQFIKNRLSDTMVGLLQSLQEAKERNQRKRSKL